MDKIELIDRAELMEYLRIVFPCSSCWEEKEPCIGLCYSVKMAVMLTPTIDAAPVRRGEWKEIVVIENDCRLEYWICSACGKQEFCEYDFCPNCGADMRKVSK